MENAIRFLTGFFSLFCLVSSFAIGFIIDFQGSHLGTMAASSILLLFELKLFFTIVSGLAGIIVQVPTGILLFGCGAKTIIDGVKVRLSCNAVHSLLHGDLSSVSLPSFSPLASLFGKRSLVTSSVMNGTESLDNLCNYGTAMYISNGVASVLTCIIVFVAVYKIDLPKKRSEAYKNSVQRNTSFP